MLVNERAGVKVNEKPINMSDVDGAYPNCGNLERFLKSIEQSSIL